MTTRSRTKAVFMVLSLIFVGMVAGFFMGAITANAVAKRKDNPDFWRKSVHKLIDQLHPTAEQRPRLDARTESAVQELITFRQEAIIKVWGIVDRAATDIDKELTPEQREKFGKMKPKRPAEVPGTPAE